MFTRMLFALLILGPSAYAKQSGDWSLVSNHEAIDMRCALSESKVFGLIRKTTFTITTPRDGDYPALTIAEITEDVGMQKLLKLRAQCQAAVNMARENFGKTSLYVNFETGEVQPDTGFFVESPIKMVTDSK